MPRRPRPRGPRGVASRCVQVALRAARSLAGSRSVAGTALAACVRAGAMLPDWLDDPSDEIVASRLAALPDGAARTDLLTSWLFQAALGRRRRAVRNVLVLGHISAFATRNGQTLFEAAGGDIELGRFVSAMEDCCVEQLIAAQSMQPGAPPLAGRALAKLKARPKAKSKATYFLVPLAGVWLLTTILAFAPVLGLACIALGACFHGSLGAFASSGPGWRNPVFCGAACGLCSLLFLIYWTRLFASTRSHYVLSSAIFAVGNYMLYAFAKLMHWAPGPLAEPCADDGCALELAMRAGAVPVQLCVPCRRWIPDRAKHCVICNMCVAEMDHHCVWTNACVGRDTRLTFVVFVAAVNTTFALFATLAVFYMMQSMAPDVRQIHTMMLVCWAEHPFICVALVWCACAMPFTLHLLARQIRTISAGLTTNEYFNAHKLTYLQTATGAFSNPFDSGLLQNWRAIRSGADVVRS